MKIPLEKQLEEVYQIFNKDHARLRRQLLDSVSEPKAEFRQIEPPQRSGASFGGRIIMSRAIKIAAGIILIGIIAVGIRHFTGSKISTSVAFGQVLRQIQNSSPKTSEFFCPSIQYNCRFYLSRTFLLQPVGWLSLLLQIVVVSYPYSFLKFSKGQQISQRPYCDLNCHQLVSRVNIAMPKSHGRTRPASGSTTIYDTISFGPSEQSDRAPG